MSVTVTVPEAAALLGVSERTVWRRVRDGRVASTRVGRHVRVLVDPSPSRPARIAEAAVDDGTEQSQADPLVGPWPFTAINVAAHREREPRARRAALAEIVRLAAETRPDPDGLTVLDYLRPWRDPDADEADEDAP